MNVLGTVGSFSQFNCENENRLENGQKQKTGAEGEDFKGEGSGGQQNTRAEKGKGNDQGRKKG